MYTYERIYTHVDMHTCTDVYVGTHTSTCMFRGAMMLLCFHLSKLLSFLLFPSPQRSQISPRFGREEQWPEPFALSRQLQFTSACTLKSSLLSSTWRISKHLLGRGLARQRTPVILPPLTEEDTEVQETKGLVCVCVHSGGCLWFRGNSDPGLWTESSSLVPPAPCLNIRTGVSPAHLCNAVIVDVFKWPLKQVCVCVCVCVCVYTCVYTYMYIYVYIKSTHTCILRIRVYPHTLCLSVEEQACDFIIIGNSHEHLEAPHPRHVSLVYNSEPSRTPGILPGSSQARGLAQLFNQGGPGAGFEARAAFLKEQHFPLGGPLPLQVHVPSVSRNSLCTARC
ncbi:uncharacterized protein C10orf143 homolog isoform X1 [Vombatus ursinus]|uniref:uncharacterized protein C10orf143 homolog isoform X1 n=1 Tax=Vombatus ursinus TaxID=29139 RepID=UPI000FFD45E4|nr:uncharacterized protein C10orf143 homolog isoform X1 [Vombatus ursinus]